ncbi:MAG: aspartate 1-decarboxylase [archaeon]
MRTMLKSKIHKATITGANLAYVGSITIDEDLLHLVDLWENEQVLVVNNNNGERWFTYVLKGERGSGVICSNGASARKVEIGDEVIIMGFATTKKRIVPRNILVDERNRFVRYLGEKAGDKIDKHTSNS